MIFFVSFIFRTGNWLKHIPNVIPYPLLSSFAVALISIFPLRTLFQEADLFFLLPFERHMRSYLNYSIFYSYLHRVTLQVVALIVLFPLFNRLEQGTLLYFFLFELAALIFPYLGFIAKLEWMKAKKPFWIIQVVQRLLVTNT
ncbi:ABC transporter permease [Staphylococcus simulans]